VLLQCIKLNQAIFKANNTGEPLRRVVRSLLEVFTWEVRVLIALWNKRRIDQQAQKSVWERTVQTSKQRTKRKCFAVEGRMSVTDAGQQEDKHPVTETSQYGNVWHKQYYLICVEVSTECF